MFMQSGAEPQGWVSNSHAAQSPQARSELLPTLLVHRHVRRMLVPLILKCFLLGKMAVQLTDM